MNSRKARIGIALVLAGVLLMAAISSVWAIRERISILASEDVVLRNGADFIMYSDDQQTQKLLIDGATGSFNGLVLGYPTPGLMQVCGRSTITGSLALGSASHGLTTAVYRAWCTLAQDPTGDAQTCSTSTSDTTVTVKVWKSAATPTANSVGAVVDWCVIGK